MDKITLNLNVDQINLIFGALSELPFKMSAKIIEELNQQIAPQLVGPKNSNFPPETVITKT